MDQAYYDNLNAQMADQYQRDRQLNNIVTVLQGLAAMVGIIAFVYTIRKQAS